MKATLYRRLALLEARQGTAARRVHVVTATDEHDRDQQVTELVAAGAVGPLDGFLCLTGKTPAQPF